VLRPETKARARALQILYAWELAGGPSLPETAAQIAELTGLDAAAERRATELATAVSRDRERLDRYAADAAEHWRLERIAPVERNILRLGIHELLTAEVPPKVAINEAVQLAHWFGGARSPGFVNGVLDRVAHALGRL
jgi:N utilization substance protein B